MRFFTLAGVAFTSSLSSSLPTNTLYLSVTFLARKPMWVMRSPMLTGRFTFFSCHVLSSVAPTATSFHWLFTFTIRYKLDSPASFVFKATFAIGLAALTLRSVLNRTTSTPDAEDCPFNSKHEPPLYESMCVNSGCKAFETVSVPSP